MALNLPLKNTRLTVLTLTEISSIIASAASVNAIAKYNDEKTALRHSVPSDVSVNINMTDMEDTIIVLYVITLLLAMQAGNFLALLAKDWLRPHWPPRITHPRDGIAISTRTLGVQSWYLALSALAILAVLIPATVFAAHRSPDVKVFREGAQFFDSNIQATVASLGLSGVYWNHFPVRFMIVTNWVNVVFNIMAVPASFTALSRRKASFMAMSQRTPDSTIVPAAERKGEQASV